MQRKYIFQFTKLSEGPFSAGVCYQGSISSTHYGSLRGIRTFLHDHELSQTRFSGKRELLKQRAGAKWSAIGEPSLRVPAFLNNWPLPSSEMIGSAKLRKREHENKTWWNWSHADIFAYLSLTRNPYYVRAWNRVLNKNHIHKCGYIGLPASVTIFFRDIT